MDQMRKVLNLIKDEDDDTPSMPRVSENDLAVGIPTSDSYPFFTHRNSIFLDVEPPVSGFTYDNESMLQLAKDGHFLQMVASLKYGSDLDCNATDGDGRTILHHACIWNDKSALMFLLNETNVEVNAVDAFGGIPLHLLARSKELDVTSYADTQKDMTKALIDSGAQVNVQDDDGKTPLHYAAQFEKTGITEALLESGQVDLQLKSKYGETALHVCASSATRSVNVCRMLLKHFTENAPVESVASLKDMASVDNFDQTPLHKAANIGNLAVVKAFKDEAIERFTLGKFRILINKSTDVNKKTPLLLAVENGHYELTGILLKDIDRGSLAGTGASVLHYAAWVGDVKALEMGFTKNDKDLQDKHRRTPLHYAAKHNKIESIKFLLDKKVKVGKKDEEGQTPLLIAASNGFKEPVKLLIDADSNIFTVNDLGQNIIHCCVLNGHLNLLKFLISCYSEIETVLDQPDKEGNTPLHSAIIVGERNISQFLIDEANVPIDIENKRYDTPLSLAAQNGHPEIVQCIMKKESALPLLFHVNHTEDTPLHTACSSGNKIVTQLLLNRGADVLVMNINRMTPLMCAAENGHTACCKLILEKDKDAVFAGNNENTALHLAARNGHVQVVKLLLEFEAKLSIKNKSKQNPLELAIAEGKEQVAMTIVKSNHWKSAMRSIDMEENGKRTSPFRKLIEKFPKVAEVVLDRCCVIDKSKQVYNIDFEFVEDTCIEYTGIQSGRTKPYSRNFSVVQENHALNIMIEHDRTNLLGHTVCQHLVKQKWNTFGRPVYYINLILFLLYLLALTLYILFTADETYLQGLCSDWSCNVTNCESLENMMWERKNIFIKKDDVLGFQIALILLASMNLLKEAMQLFQECRQDRIQWQIPKAETQSKGTLKTSSNFGIALINACKRFFPKRMSYMTVQNLMDVLTFSFAILLAVDVDNPPSACSIRYAWQWRVGTFAVFLGWCNLILRIRKFPTLGIYVVMLTTILKTFCQFFIVFFLFLMTFTLTFYMLFRKFDPFQCFLFALYKTSAMTIGDLDLEHIFFDNEPPFFYLSYIFFGLFMILMPILIMNLLVGLAVDDIKVILENAKLKGLAMKIKLLMDIEVAVPKFMMLNKNLLELVYKTDLQVPVKEINNV